jgi:DNA repair protein RadD
MSKAGQTRFDTTGLHARGGEFVADEVEDLMDQDALVRSACAEIVEATRHRHACLIFASGVRHGRHIADVLRDRHGIACGFVCGDTPTEERDATLARFKAGELKYLCNVNVLTTGFDAPNVDCVVLLRPTLSPGLYYQMVGRGFRLHPSKVNCLVLDFGGNVLRHGPVDRIRVKTANRDGSGDAPAKECPECQALIAAGYATCPECGHVFPPPEKHNHDAKASTAAVLSGQVTVETFPVRDVTFSVHIKRGAADDAPKSMRVDYRIGWGTWQSEWICFEHTGYARQKAISWWKRRSNEPIPKTAAEAVAVANAGGLAPTKAITVRSVSGEEYDRIIGYELGTVPALLEEQDLPAGALDFPFGAYNNGPENAAEDETPWSGEVPW